MNYKKVAGVLCLSMSVVANTIPYNVLSSPMEVMAAVQENIDNATVIKLEDVGIVDGIKKVIINQSGNYILTGSNYVEEDVEQGTGGVYVDTQIVIEENVTVDLYLDNLEIKNDDGTDFRVGSCSTYGMKDTFSPIIVNGTANLHINSDSSIGAVRDTFTVNGTLNIMESKMTNEDVLALLKLDYINLSNSESDDYTREAVSGTDNLNIQGGNIEFDASARPGIIMVSSNVRITSGTFMWKDDKRKYINSDRRFVIDGGNVEIANLKSKTWNSNGEELKQETITGFKQGQQIQQIDHYKQTDVYADVSGNLSVFMPITEKFIGCVGEGAVIKNIVTTGTVHGNYATGGIVGESRCGGNVTFENCINDAEVIGESTDAAGIIGTNSSNGDGQWATLVYINCANRGSVTAPEFASAFCGYASDKPNMTNCYSTGTITNGNASNVDYSFIRYNTQTSINMTNCYQLKADNNQSLDGLSTITEQQLTSGELAWMLNGSNNDAEAVWYQTCGQGFPDLNGDALTQIVYQGYADCSQDAKSFINTKHLKQGHEYECFVTDEEDGTKKLTYQCKFCKEASEATAILSVEDTLYDGEEHGVMIQYSSNWSEISSSDIVIKYASTADGEYSITVPCQPGTWYALAYVDGQETPICDVMSYVIEKKQDIVNPPTTTPDSTPITIPNPTSTPSPTPSPTPTPSGDETEDSIREIFVGNQIVKVTKTEGGAYVDENNNIISSSIVETEWNHTLILDSNGKIQKNCIATTLDGERYYAGKDGKLVENQFITTKRENLCYV